MWKKLKKIELEAKINAQVIWVYFFLFLKEKIMFKSYKIKSDHRVLRKIK
jgi:hypothetical protein